MAKSDLIEMKNCEVIECLPGTRFKVKLPNEKIITAALSGNLRLYKIRVITGDIVSVAVSPYDLTTGIITWRNS